MRNVVTIIKKEFKRFFTDRRLVLSVLVIPALMIYFMYSLIGGVITDKITIDEDYAYKVYAVGMPEDIKSLFESAEIKLEYLPVDDLNEEQLKANVKEKIADVYVLFPEDFSSAMMSENKPNVEIFYSSAEAASTAAYSIVTALLNGYESAIVNLFNINAEQKDYDLSTSEDQSGMMFASILPMLMMSMLFSSCMAVAPESIAGEKERGTLATILVTPVKRSELAIGKTVSLSVIALLGGISSFIGIVASIPKLLAGYSLEVSYSFGQYAALMGIVAATVLLIVALISIISAYSKTVKQASTLISPLMILSMLLGLTTMFSDGAIKSLWAYFIPIYNTVQAMNGILSFEFLPLHIVITVVSNIVYTIALIYLLTVMFKSEKIMFGK